MINARDIAILDILQRDSDTSLSEMGEKVHLSPSACSRRIAQLREAGFIRRNVALLDRATVGLPTTLFVTVGSGEHSEEWTSRFRQAVAEIPEIVEAHRMTGSVDYILKIVLPNVEDYDRVYKQLIRRIKMTDVSAFISMETVKSVEALPLTVLRNAASQG
ncbi:MULTISPECIES: Lrp/AsnC family transcriptional regulator [Azospirillaceae]|uniref:Lrp/AsnC family transcriptional regulator n=1 Tax=Azospirillaceae TaxID=2829815 RepID=UPI000B6B4A2F|nr:MULTISPECIES: Lrp/AsnC family transcriptional regulator [Azospirillaceae]MDG5495995.1 Lrp/AsnC family transcriptional regulator [Niveispirillum sp. BGYR6]SNS51657.1 transcriptional regulator, AsnC family [Azospirillum sp. RU38E]SNS69870.1 transcriptional regulator, AsnC family [Azospirillum sp. RU37A]